MKAWKVKNPHWVPGTVLPWVCAVWAGPLLKAGHRVRIRGYSRRPGTFVSLWERIVAAEPPLSGIEKTGAGCTADFTSDGQEPLNRGPYHSLNVLPGGLVCPPLTAWNRGRYPGTLRAAGCFCISLGARRASAGIR